MTLLELIRGLVRPFLAYTGWLALIVFVSILLWRFGDADMMKYLVGAFAGSLTTLVGFYVNDRSRRE